MTEKDFIELWKAIIPKDLLLENMQNPFVIQSDLIRDDKRPEEWFCTHGVGHYVNEEPHGCDGCCGLRDTFDTRFHCHCGAKGFKPTDTGCEFCDGLA